MTELLTASVVVLAGTYLLVLGALCSVAPERAARFLSGFAGSARLHYLELGLRFLAGAAFVRHAPGMLLPGVFQIFGWVLLVTTAGLVLVPWRWHRRFAEQSVPRALRHIGLMGVASLATGGFILYAALNR